MKRLTPLNLAPHLSHFKGFRLFINPDKFREGYTLIRIKSKRRKRNVSEMAPIKVLGFCKEASKAAVEHMNTSVHCRFTQSSHQGRGLQALHQSEDLKLSKLEKGIILATVKKEDGAISISHVTEIAPDEDGYASIYVDHKIDFEHAIGHDEFRKDFKTKPELELEKEEGSFVRAYSPYYRLTHKLRYGKNPKFEVVDLAYDRLTPVK